jgi:hypothetical protein
MHGWGMQFKTGEYFNINFKLIVIFSWVSYVSLAQQIRSKMKYSTDTSKCHPRCWDLHSVKTCEKLPFEPYLRLNFLHRGKRTQTTNCLICMPTAANIFRTDYFPLNHVLIYVEIFPGFKLYSPAMHAWNNTCIQVRAAIKFAQTIGAI